MIPHVWVIVEFQQTLAVLKSLMNLGTLLARYVHRAHTLIVHLLKQANVKTKTPLLYMYSVYKHYDWHSVSYPNKRALNNS